MKVNIEINTNILTVKETTVVRYFFLLLFKFLYAKTPPVLNTFSIIFGVFSFLFFIFISSEFLNCSIGLTFAAFFAELIADKYIVINPNIIEIIIWAESVIRIIICTQL